MDEVYENSAYSQYGVVQHLYEDEDGTVYEGNPEELTKQLEEYSPADMYNDLNSDLTDLAESYGVEVELLKFP